jgi:hypothetical protein
VAEQQEEERLTGSDLHCVARLSGDRRVERNREHFSDLQCRAMWEYSVKVKTLYLCIFPVPKIDRLGLLTLSSARQDEKKGFTSGDFRAKKCARMAARKEQCEKKVENENLWSTLNYNLLWLRFFRFAFFSSSSLLK